MRIGRTLRLIVSLALLAAGSGATAERVKDLAAIAGVRDNQLIGYGLVVGLDGTGDQTSQTPFTVQSLKNMLKQLGVTLPENVSLQLKNVAAVMVNATLPPFARPGQHIDVTVSSLGNAKSLRGGTLLMTRLKGADGAVYAVAQGNVVVGGFGVESEGSSVTINVPSAGRIPGGATVERAVPTPFATDDFLVLNLHRADFTTARRLAAAIDGAFGEGTAQAIDAGSVRVRTPADPAQRVAFMSEVENLSLDPGEAPARVIVNARTGTVVISRTVRVTAAAVSHGSLSVTITSNPVISQPPPLSGGATVVQPASDIDVEQRGGQMFVFDPGVSLEDIVRAVNGVGAGPGDLVAILEALRQAGALRAELIVI